MPPSPIRRTTRYLPTSNEDNVPLNLLAAPRAAAVVYAVADSASLPGSEDAGRFGSSGIHYSSPAAAKPALLAPARRFWPLAGASGPCPALPVPGRRF